MIGLGIRGRLLIAGITAATVAVAFGLAALVNALAAPWSWLVAAVGIWLMVEAIIRTIIWGADRWAGNA